MTQSTNKPATEIIFDMLVRNLEAWDDEEDSVKEEHADLIRDTRRLVNAYLAPWGSSQAGVTVVVGGQCQSTPSSNNGNSSEQPQLPWLAD
jgi:hypothetical protein